MTFTYVHFSSVSLGVLIAIGTLDSLCVSSLIFLFVTQSYTEPTQRTTGMKPV
jgi:hypothetical protein